MIMRANMYNTGQCREKGRDLDEVYGGDFMLDDCSLKSSAVSTINADVHIYHDKENRTILYMR